MKMRQLMIRVLAGGMAAMIAMSPIAPMTAQACEAEERIEAIAEAERLMHEEPTETTGAPAETTEPESETAIAAETPTEAPEEPTTEASAATEAVEESGEATTAESTEAGKPTVATETTTETSATTEAPAKPEEANATESTGTETNATTEEPATAEATDEPEATDTDAPAEPGEADTDAAVESQEADTITVETADDEEATIEEPEDVAAATPAEPEEAATTESTDTEPTATSVDSEAATAAAPADSTEDTAAPAYKAKLVRTDVKEIPLTQSKSKRIITEYLKNNERVITTQYLINGEVVLETVFASQDLVDELKEQEAEEAAIREEEQARRDEARRQKEEEARRKLEEEQRKLDEIRKTYGFNSIDELLDSYFRYITNTDADSRKYNIVELSDEGDEEERDYVSENLIKLYSNGLSGLIKLMPGANFYGDTLNGLLGNLLGLKKDAPPVDMQEVVNQNTQDIKDSILQSVKENKDNTVTISSLTTYGNRLDVFANDATNRAKQIDNYREDTELSDAAKAVKIANLIGHSDDWATGKDNANIMTDLTAAAEVFKGNTNVESRDIYSLIYDLHKGDSLFAGEAMAQSEATIRKTVNSFLRNCGVVIECLKAHQEVARLTEEEVASLDPHTRGLYEQIKSDTSSINARIRTIGALLIGDANARYEDEKTGIFAKAEEYYAKDKTTYIDHGRRNIALNSKLNITYGRELMTPDGRTGDVDRISRMAHGTGLTTFDYDKINIQAMSMGMTLSEYLKYCGFDTSEVDHGYKYLVTDSFSSDPWELLGTADGYRCRGTVSYDMNGRNAQKSNCSLSEYHLMKVYGLEDTISKNLNKLYNQDVAWVFFEAKK